MPHLRLITVLMLLFTVFLSSAKTRTLTGTVLTLNVDSLEQLPNANVALLNADSTFVKGCMTDDSGSFKIQYNQSKGKNYMLRVTYTGMKAYFRNLPDTLSNFNLGKILLESNSKLGEVVVSAPMKIIDSKGDTTIINAEAFKLRDGATLNELVKRVPGLEYDPKTKAIKYNGTSISGIYINGKPFFNGKNEVAMDNLPAEIIEKMKIYDKRSEEEEFTGVKRSTQENYVLDLKTKEKFNGTIIATAGIGAGNYHKKQIDGNLNLFKQNGDNLTLYLNSGNKDMQSPEKGNRSDNINMNMSKNIGKEFSVNGNLLYYYSRTKGDRNQSYDEQYLITGNRYQHSENSSLNKNNLVYGNFNASWNHKKTLLMLRANINNSNSDGSNDSHRAVYTSPTGMPLRNPFESDIYNSLPDSIKLNEAYSNSSSKNGNSSYRLGANLSQRLNDKGTNINVNIGYNKSNNTSDLFSVSSTTYYKLLNYLGNDSVLYRNQYQNGPGDTKQMSAGLGISQRIGKKFNVELKYSYEFSRQSSNRNTFDLSPFSDGNDQSMFSVLPDGYQEHYVDSLSNRSLRKNSTNSIGLNMSFNYSNYSINAEFSVNPLRETLYQKTGRNEADTIRNSIDYRAGLMVMYHKDKTSFHLNYNGQTSQPSLSDLLTLTDNIDPMNITRGNPNLKPSFRQNIHLSFHNMDLGLNGNASFSNTFNSVTQAVTYNPVTGGRESYPVNINGNCNADASLGYYKNFKSRFDISVNSTYGYNRYVSLINEGRKESPDKSITRGNRTGVSLKAAYAPKWGGFGLNGSWNFSHDVNSLRETSTYSRDYSVGLDWYAMLPGEVMLRSESSYTFRNGTYMASDLNNQVTWNASVTWRFLKKREALLSVEWNDILNDRKNYSRNVSSNGLNESYSRQVGSYFMVSFKYSFTHISGG